MNLHVLGTGLARCAALALCALLASPAALQAQTRQLLNYEAIHKPVHGERGMVVSQNEVASAIGAQVLRDGGNAVDAAVATAFALAVLLPRAGNIGGDGYMLVHLAGEGRTVAIDYRSVAPAAATLERFFDADGKLGGDKAGWMAAGVPGTVAGLALAHRQYGRLPWAKLVQPAIGLAEEGVVLTRDEAFALDWGRERLARSEAGANVFLRPDGSALRAGERLRQRDLGWSLRQIARHGGDAFYRGPIADRLVAAMQRHGGLITRADLEAYRALEREPLNTTYRGHTVVTMPPSSGGGTSIVQMLNLLEHVDMGAHGAGSAAALHAMTEATKLAWADRARHAGDPAFVQVPARALASKAYAAERFVLFSPERTLDATTLAAGDPMPYESPSTTHFSVIDAEGNAVSNTYTVGSDFGAGVMAEGTGFLLGNLVGNFSLQAQRDMATDPSRATNNVIGAGRRPVSSMSPTLLLRDGKVRMVTGSPGGNTIPGTVMQSIVDVVDFGMNIAEATSQPRIHQDMRSGTLQVERGISPDTLDLLRALGHRIETGETIGSTQILMVGEDGIEGAADPRRPGAGAVAQ
ncbi:gamma-glutamyltransferase [Pseudoxanthomonas daejeonensis]|uniref:gamma-glutamyltransferase n=1 Tax=Pseudoxanthomonas daejeonensis TaxID=266062 RepID=UPI001F54061F|nr:gamma-glutamyltransferase [Pseudoxanthomonas daejeonensis]UNK56168.1 gamma-glutamyltransferase [Pseudoxanthomonas daejeonensis]